MRANKVKCSRAVKVPMRASNCGQYPIKRRTSVLVMVKGVNHQTVEAWVPFFAQVGRKLRISVRRSVKPIEVK